MPGILGVALLGLPGAFFREIARALLYIDTQGCLGVDVWSAIATGFAYAIARPRFPGSRAKRFTLVALFWLVAGLFLAAGLYIMAQNQAAASPTHRPVCTSYTFGGR